MRDRRSRSRAASAMDTEIDKEAQVVADRWAAHPLPSCGTHVPSAVAAMPVSDSRPGCCPT